MQTLKAPVTIIVIALAAMTLGMQNPANQTFFAQLKVIDWQTIFLRLMSSDEGQKFTLMQAAIAIRRYGLFLFLLQKYPHLKMVPNQEIDAVLHAHIANAHQFQEDCQNLFNVCLKHVPEVGLGGEVEQQEWLLTFAHTQTLFEQNFGQGAMGSSVAACCEILLNA
ncbi:hypothetical protein [Iningainema tapete]|uniref:Extracellular globin n=1 Tax=Iningainema tapete BLCC-T55 TaxID=2748662 RepID=A0A8J6XLG3_9CYAN|nr:hypothetical protein [Iningainema tapete]MBD2775242.1 hypothetical protein [Iningainema tapete BLCC-T55]